MTLHQTFIGKKLKRDILTEGGRFLLTKDTLLQQIHISLLTKNEITLEKEDVVNPEEAIIQETTEQIKEIFHFTKEKNRVPLDEVEKVIIPTVYELSAKQDVFSILSHLQSKDDYTYRHNIGVAVLSILIGKWINVTAEQLSHLATAALLHDIGKVKIPDDILNKPGKLTDEEYELMKRHTIYGYEILQNTGNSSVVYASVAIQHHEREDGSGYPHKLKAEQMHPFSKIVAIADIFHAMTSKRVYRNPLPFYEVINQMHAERFGKLNPQLLHTFINKMMDSIVGKLVLLSDGREGRIKFIHPFHPASPLIETSEGFVDLYTDTSTNIKAIFS